MQDNYEPEKAKKSTRTLPDANWIRNEIPIADVARGLGLKGDGRLFDCFREEHGRGKKRRSLSVHMRSNTARCFVCDRRSLSNIDLVMAVTGQDVGAAIRWLAERFPGVPVAKVRTNSGRPRIFPKGGYEMSLQDLIISPGWVGMSSSAKIVLLAIFSRTPAAGSEQGCLRCTYNKLIEWTGLHGRPTIAKALKELRKAGAIQTSTVPTNLVTRRGFRLNQLFVRVSPRAMQPPCCTPHTATGHSVQDLNSQYAVQKLNSFSQSLEDLEAVKEVRVQ